MSGRKVEGGMTRREFITACGALAAGALYGGVRVRLLASTRRCAGMALFLCAWSAKADGYSR